jgi:hypothetical protein
LTPITAARTRSVVKQVSEQILVAKATGGSPWISRATTDDDGAPFT